MHIGLLSALICASTDAPITSVTIFTDQARVVRTAQLEGAGKKVVEFPALQDGVDVASIRVESPSADIDRVDISRLTPEAIRSTEVKALLGQLDELDVKLNLARLERDTMVAQQEAMQRLSPVVETSTPLKPSPKLGATGWATAAQFVTAQLDRAQRLLRDGDEHLKRLNEQRARLVEQAQKLSNPEFKGGWKVVAHVSANAPGDVTLTYLARNVRWTPTWDLQLQPETGQVNLALAALVAQSTGEDWTDAALTLSTAIPSNATQAPKLLTWKIGVVDRFIPTPSPVPDSFAPPPPRAVDQQKLGKDFEPELLRRQLVRVGGSGSETTKQELPPPAPPPPSEKFRSYDFESETLEGDSAFRSQKMMPSPEMVAPVQSAPMAAAPMAAPAPARSRASSSSRGYARENRAESGDVAVTVSGSVVSDKRGAERDEPRAQFGLSPPPAWTRPTFGPDSPVTLAKGYDLAFPALQKESVPSGKGDRRIALWSAQWPVSVERKLYPALTRDAFLVAELKNPSKQVLPGGLAQLYVGADPSGTAKLQLVSPGEPFTLPLGIDRALKPVRNVQLVESTEGVISKEEVGTYTVSIELANPYRVPVAVRVYDQWPVTDQKDVVTKLVASSPTAIQDAKNGGLEWRLSIPAQQKSQLSFTYTLRRPRGWKLNQYEVQR
jgi:hypothetical protein